MPTQTSAVFCKCLAEWKQWRREGKTVGAAPAGFYCNYVTHSDEIQYACYQLMFARSDMFPSKDVALEKFRCVEIFLLH